MARRAGAASAAAPVAILVALAAALALAGQGERAQVPPGDPLPAGTAVVISAPAPAQTLPEAVDDPGLHPAVAAAMRRSWSAVERAGIDPTGELLAELAFATVAVERSCPPPAVLACRPAVRITGRLDGDPSPSFERNLGIALAAGLRATGYGALTVHRAPGDELAGRISSRGEELARWQRSGEAVEVVTGGLEPRIGAGSGGDDPAAGRASGVAFGAEVRIETSPEDLEALLR